MALAKIINGKALARSLIKIYPNIRWLLYGDSGEKDREIYLKLAQKYTKNIKAIYIRDVNSGKFIRLLP